MIPSETSQRFFYYPLRVITACGSLSQNALTMKNKLSGPLGSILVLNLYRRRRGLQH
jgi:hypothetical protein